MPPGIILIRSRYAEFARLLIPHVSEFLFSSKENIGFLVYPDKKTIIHIFFIAINICYYTTPLILREQTIIPPKLKSAGSFIMSIKFRKPS